MAEEEDLDDDALQERALSLFTSSSSGMALVEHGVEFGASSLESEEPAIPLSYWASKGFGDDYTSAVESVLSRMKKISQQMRKDGAKGWICLLFRPDRDDTMHYDDRMHYDEALLSHWGEFVASLSQMFLDEYWKGSTGFNISGIELPPIVQDMLLPALDQNPFKCLHFENNGFDRFTGMSFLVDAIKNSPKLKQLHLLHNPIFTQDNTDLFVDAINEHPTLESVTIMRSGSASGPPDALCSLFTGCKMLKTINLFENNIGSRGSTLISDFLATNPCLENLELSLNKFNDIDAGLIAIALKSNTNLQNLRLEANSLTKVGRDALLKAVFDALSINSLFGSNHSCQINLGPQFPKIKAINGQGMRKYDPKTRAYIKIALILSSPADDNVKIGLLSDIPVGLMHEILEFVANYPVNTTWAFMLNMLQEDKEVKANDMQEKPAEIMYDGPNDCDVIFCDDSDDENEDEGMDLEAVQLKSLTNVFHTMRGLAVPVLFGN